MANIKIDVSRCKGCCLCIGVCPRANLRMSNETNQAGHFYAKVIDTEECTGCALCCVMCPDVAIEIAAEQPAVEREQPKTVGVKT